MVNTVDYVIDKECLEKVQHRFTRLIKNWKNWIRLLRPLKVWPVDNGSKEEF